jgi:hypothetical protein
MFVAGLRQTAHPVFLGFRWIMVAAGPPGQMAVRWSRLTSLGSQTRFLREV